MLRIGAYRANILLSNKGKSLKGSPAKLKTGKDGVLTRATLKMRKVK